MTKFEILALLAGVVLLLAIPAAALAQEPIPARYWGSVKVDEEPAAEGTTVTAFVGVDSVATATVDSDGNYVIEIHGSNAGETATFNVGDYTAAESVIVTAGSHNQDLTVAGGLQGVEPEARYYGTVTVNGQTAADGIVVIAWIDGASVSSDIVKDGQYLLVVDSAYIGREVRFEVDGNAADQAVTVGPGFAKLDLTAYSAPRTPEHEFANLISAGILDSVFRFNNTDKTWDGYSPDAPAAANDLDIINSGDRLWISVSADGEYAGEPLTPVWNLVAAP